MQGFRPTLLVAMLLVLGLAPSYAQETADWVPETSKFREASAKADDRIYLVKDDWRFFVAPYLWLVGNNISISRQGARGATAGVDVPWFDYVPDYFSKVVGAMGRIEAWKGRWGFFVDNVYIYVTDSAGVVGSKKILPNAPVPVYLIAAGTGKVIVRQGFLDVGGRYLLGTLSLSADKRLPLVSCELLGGVRYNWFNQSTSLAIDATLTTPATPVQLTRSKNFDLSFNYMVVEPFLGLRTGFWFTEKLNLLLRADIGGFGVVAYEDFNSNIEALAGYKVHDRVRLYVGYRGRYYSFNKGSDSVKSFGWYHGPLLGAGFAF